MNTPGGIGDQLPGHSDPNAPQAAGRADVPHGLGGQEGHQGCAVPCCPCHRADDIQRRACGEAAFGGDESTRRLESGDPAHGCGDPGAPRSVCAQSCREDPGSDPVAGSCARTAGPPSWVPGVPGDREGSLRIRASRSVLGHRGLAEDDPSSAAEAVYRWRIPRRPPRWVEDETLTGGRRLPGCNEVLDAERHASQRAKVLSDFRARSILAASRLAPERALAMDVRSGNESITVVLPGRAAGCLLLLLPAGGCRVP